MGCFLIISILWERILQGSQPSALRGLRIFTHGSQDSESAVTQGVGLKITLLQGVGEITFCEEIPLRLLRTFNSHNSEHAHVDNSDNLLFLLVLSKGLCFPNSDSRTFPSSTVMSRPGSWSSWTKVSDLQLKIDLLKFLMSSVWSQQWNNWPVQQV